MLRLTRTDSDLTLEQLERSQKALLILKKYGSPQVVPFFAVPTTPTADKIDWLSQHNGKINSYQDLPAAKKKQLLHEANQHITTVRLLQIALQDQGLDAEAQLLSPFTADLNPNHLYAVNNKPVLTHWITNTIPIANEPNAAVPICSLPSSPTPPKKRNSYLLRVSLWLLLLLLLLLVGALVWWGMGKWQNKESTAAVSEEIINEVDDTSPDLIVIFDTSHSMTLNTKISKAEEDWYYSTDINTIEQLKKALVLEQEPSRFAAAKETVGRIFNQLPAEGLTSLLSFKSCEAINDHGVFEADRHEELYKTMLGLQPTSGTPSGDALSYAAESMDGIKKPGVIMLVTDGESSCGSHVCTAAANIAKSKPLLRIDVIDITGFGLSNCVAEKTGGRVYNHGDSIQLNQTSTNLNCQ